MLAHQFLLTISLCSLLFGSCVAQSVVREAVPNDCHRFYETRLLTCPPEFHWSSQLQRCDLQTTADCSTINPVPNWSKPIQIEPIPNPAPVNKPESYNLSEACKEKLGQLIAYPGDCTRFIHCDYLPFVKSCPQYLYWNSHLLTCDKICV
ncbi:uncharacterized protein LOC119555385 [Drosophila subpulchrella]|uniref:uncharacterized protein LOC119555385 n=1 Tax=Drosophila subpulchrella TaxID=1486046 RepID=UPI0018A1B3F8|nr:uncharacterized protein LOC119555385 [Drosophila subpulchrella]